MTSVGRVLLAQRAFLGVTFLYAGLSKLADPHFAALLSAQLTALAPASPLGAVLRAAQPHAHLLAGAIAVAETGVGAATLAGLFARFAAAVGALLSLSFLLTVSWQVHPYYYGSDSVYLVCWLPLIAVGAGGVLSLDARRARARAAPTGRRELLAGAAWAGALAAVTGALGGAGLLLRRLTATGPASIVIANTSAVPVGSAVSFTDPATGRLAYAVQPSPGRFVGLSGICTHALCTVNWQPGQHRFYCPCHGSLFDGATGQVLRGPAPSPLPRVPIEVVDGRLETRPPG